MSKFLAPLWVFAGGNLLLLVFWLFMPALGDSATTLAANPNISTFWGMNWLTLSVKLLVVVVGEMLILYATAKVFLKTKA